ncbi:L-carnitine dehydratase/bile acid-inducible protein F [Formosa agariphila KMM 3901]|uniref:L-carnitine dehydratase/bile acid-inducible protein F n=1 Tax=Formosa agariphila (strain DSM 15362 / KCTC 12365 / LMG 23005 / KMM 3901 / M-2Alg 35-1) TaxID=1347342 RepID=T2KPF5_FORAG|nr:CaiB/BaiF CoA-transferase family protein [Formosa agariphila]CDF79864.1 L-carnitine dehydratase/bile acid-inducible protein F [Formosa agariphila KMM 3901]
MDLPLKGITVLEFSQFMAGPSAGLKMADLGARVIKIERPGTGEAGRQIALKNIFIDESSMVFHTANRNKQSYAANLKDPEDLEKIKKLIAQADVMTHNFRPGVMEKIGLDYDTVSAINNKIIYGVVSGYGPVGPWAKKPGQDLLIQSLSGFVNLTGNKADDPTATGLATSDIFTGVHLVQGILASLIARNRTGKGAKVEVSLLESTLDIQFELLTTYLNDGEKLPKRAKKGNAHVYLDAPYGIYQTKDGHISIALTPLDELVKSINLRLPEAFQNPSVWYTKRDDIMAYLQEQLIKETSAHWLSIFESLDFRVSEVFDYKTLLNHEGYKVLQMDQEVETSDGISMKTTRCPIRIDGNRIFNKKSAPKVGEDNALIEKEFNLS